MTKKRFKIRHIWVLAVILGLMCVVLIHLPIYVFSNWEKRHAMLRLEDITPGGIYASRDDIGKLRAVFSYLHTQRVPFAVAVIPRAMYLLPDGTRYEKGIDDAVPDEETQHLIRLLQTAQKKGAVLGMHGYTHQFGAHKRPDGGQDTGIGNEFAVSGAPQTYTADYAAHRMEASLSAFKKAGLTPAFWESPHYHDTWVQEEVFRSYMGILYQPDYRSLHSFWDLHMYETINTYGRHSLGSVYVPAPLRYISEGRTADDIVEKMKTYKGLGSLFYHPFLEFPYLEPVIGVDGKPSIQDGLPLYQYKSGVYTHLHRIVKGAREQGFTWVSLHDVLPFTPAQQIQLQEMSGTIRPRIVMGDIKGTGRTQILTWSSGSITIYADAFDWPRNRPQELPETWHVSRLSTEDHVIAARWNQDERMDILGYTPATGIVQVWYSNGRGVQPPHITQLPTGAEQLQAGDGDGDGQMDLFFSKADAVWWTRRASDQFIEPIKVCDLPSGARWALGDWNGDRRVDMLVYGIGEHTALLYQNAGATQMRKLPARLSLPIGKETQVLIGDGNADGYDDITIYEPLQGIWRVWESDGDVNMRPLQAYYGPWARGKRLAWSADFDGNGTADIASFDRLQHVVDVSLSFRKSKTQ
ncbi:DUF2334 domain-containing protein [Aneurinibacillus sp. REN35]|uniref:DUF2334 domain-containing protein n=1 Tax=Aneurinibacillus sp. REN35 TaxID=3237286 RepID=UPI00352736EF